MNVVKQVSTNGEFLLWSRRGGHVLYDIDGQIVCDFGSEMPGRFTLRSVIKGWQRANRSS